MDLVFELPFDIKLPDAIPHITEIRNFIYSLKEREDYERPLERDSESDITVSEAASIAFELARERNVPQVVMCDKYFRLFQSERYLTLGGVEELLEEFRDLDTTEQLEANLAARIAAESKYNALNRLTLLHHELLKAGIGVPSSLDIKVQRSLLECMDYYSQRHRRALNGLRDYIWTKRDEIPSYKGNLDKLMEQFRYYMEMIEYIEMEMPENSQDADLREKLQNQLLNRMTKLHRVLQLASPIVPNSVSQFINQPERKAHFDLVFSVMEQFERLKRRVLELEEVRASHLADYKDALLALYDFANPHESWLQEEFQFIMQAPRDAFIIGHKYRIEHQDDEFDIPKQLITSLEHMVSRRLEKKRSEESHKEKNHMDPVPVFPDLEPDHFASNNPEMRAEGWGWKAYSLDRDDEFTEARVLEDYNITFYVKPGFEEQYDSDEMMHLMSDVITQELDRLKSQCVDEKLKKKPRVSCKRYQEIQEIINS